MTDEPNIALCRAKARGREFIGFGIAFGEFARNGETLAQTLRKTRKHAARASRAALA
jgi:hypothetical protein